jgi:hypothetical protein
MNLHYTWKNYLLSDIRSLAGDMEINQALNDRTANDCVNVAKAYKKSVYLTRVEGQSKPALLHSISTADGDGVELDFGKLKPFILSGFGNTATPFSFAPGRLFKENTVHRYPYKAIFDTEDMNSLKDIPILARGENANIQIRTCQYVPSCMANLLLNSTAKTAAEMIMVLKTFIAGSLPEAEPPAPNQGGETANEGNANGGNANVGNATGVLAAHFPAEAAALAALANAAATVAPAHTDEIIDAHGGMILQWLMNFNKTELKTTPLQPELGEGLIIQASQDLHRSRLDSPASTPPTVAATPPDQQATTFHNTEWLKQFGDKIAEALGNSSGGGTKASKLLYKQYMALGSIDGVRPLVQLSELANDILGTRDHSERVKMLSNYLLKKDIEANLSAAQARYICTGPLEWEDFETPSGLSSHLMEVAGVSGTSNHALNAEFIIRTKSSMNVKSTQDDVDRILKKDIIPPTTIDELIIVLKQQCAIIELFTHEDSILVLNLRAAISALKDRKKVIRFRLAKQPKYLLMIQYKIDFKINNLCAEAMRFCDDVDRINFEIFSNFKTIINDIDNQSLYLDYLPNFIKHLKQEEDMGDQGASKRRKLLGDTDTDLCVPVRNESPVPEWTLRPSDNYTHFIRNKKKPRICLSFWLRNKCNSACAFKHTHLEELSQKNSNLMTEFVKAVRKAKGKKDTPGDV